MGKSTINGISSTYSNVRRILFGLSHGDPTGYAPQATAIAKDTNELLGREFDHGLETR